MENDPSGGTNLTAVLQDAIDSFFRRKAANQIKDGETIIVVTDGEPDDRRSIFELIVKTTQKMDRDEELAISFIQVGSDPSAASFLRALDDQMESVGAKFDICDTVTLDDMADMSLADVLLNAIQD